MLHRIFLAINLPSKVEKELTKYQEKWQELPCHWTKRNNLHITLAFLGNASDAELEDVQEIARNIAAKHAPFTLSLSRIAYGPTEEQPKMVWAVGETSKELLSLQKDLTKALDYREENPFSLHVTLGRLNAWEFKKIEPEERLHIQEEISLDIPISSFQIIESKFKQRNIEYSIIEDIPLTT